MNYFKNQIKNGFTLLETMIAITVLMTGILSIVTMLIFNIKQTTNFKNRIIAYNLAQEGIEIVKNIRDTNWLNSLAWNFGLGDGDYQADYNDSALSAYDPNTKLKLDATNGYQYDGSGVDTVFQRRIDIENDIDKLKIESEVIYRDQTIQLESWLYNWR